MLKIENLKVEIKNSTILDGISLSVRPHTITALIGKNASGKSTLLSCLTGERKYTGKITFCDKDLALMSQKERARLISLLPQHLPVPDITGTDLVKMGRTPYLDIGRRFTKEDELQVQKALEAADAKDLSLKKISEMSGGERQKIFLAMTLAQDTRLIAFDEPTSFMDIMHEKEFYCLLTDTVKKHKKTALVVMHDLTRAVEIADSIAVMDNGKIVAHGKTKEIVKSGIIEKLFNVTRYDFNGLTIYR